jgi:glycosyltransferase involved in cell wall biosynthesis
MDRPHISVVVPVYKCPNTLPELYRRIRDTVTPLNENFEIILVDDRSPLEDWEVIRGLSEKDRRVKGVRLSRNFGQHFAITAGLDFSKGEWVVVMDCDLQDQPEEIIKLYNKAIEGYDIVVGLRAKRKDGFFKKLSSWLFWRAYNFLTDTTIDGRICNFGIYSRRAIESIKMMREHTRSFGLFALWVGFNRAEIEVRHAERKAGKSSYSFKKLFYLALDSILSYSQKPLMLFINLGIFISFISLCLALFFLIEHFYLSRTVAGWTSLIVSLYFLSGIIITCIGVVGIYGGKGIH